MMTAGVFVIVFFAVISVKGAAVVGPLVASISSQYHAQDGLGQYSYGYANEHSVKSEARTVDGIIRGGYSYTDAEGKLQSIEYTADPVHGFRATGSNIPLAANLQHVPSQVSATPEVAQAKAQHMTVVEEAKVRAVQSSVVAHPQQIVLQHLPAGVTISNDALQGGGQFLGFFYSYGFHNGDFSQPIITSYASPAPVFVPGISNLISMLPAAVAPASVESSGAKAKDDDSAGAEDNEKPTEN